MFRKGLMKGQGRHSLAQPGRNRRRIKSHRCADLERRNTIAGGELVELPLADPQKNGKFGDSKSLRFSCKISTKFIWIYTFFGAPA